MVATGIIRRFDDQGRIVIPKAIRQELFSTEETTGEPMEIFLDKKNEAVVLKKYEPKMDDSEKVQYVISRLEDLKMLNKIEDMEAAMQDIIDTLKRN